MFNIQYSSDIYGLMDRQLSLYGFDVEFLRLWGLDQFLPTQRISDTVQLVWNFDEPSLTWWYRWVHLM